MVRPRRTGRTHPSGGCYLGSARSLKYLRDRLMVGHRPLKASILVRVQVPQLIVKHPPNFGGCFTIRFLRDLDSKGGVGRELSQVLERSDVELRSPAYSAGGTILSVLE